MLRFSIAIGKQKNVFTLSDSQQSDGEGWEV